MYALHHRADRIASAGTRVDTPLAPACRALSDRLRHADRNASSTRSVVKTELAPISAARIPAWEPAASVQNARWSITVRSAAASPPSPATRLFVVVRYQVTTNLSQEKN